MPVKSQSRIVPGSVPTVTLSLAGNSSKCHSVIHRHRASCLFCWAIFWLEPPIIIVSSSATSTPRNRGRSNNYMPGGGSESTGESLEPPHDASWQRRVAPALLFFDQNLLGLNVSICIFPYRNGLPSGIIQNGGYFLRTRNGRSTYPTGYIFRTLGAFSTTRR